MSRAADSGAEVVSHDPPLHTENALTLDAALSFLSRTDLELFVELKEQGVATSVIEKLVSNKLADRSVIVRVCRRGAILSVGSSDASCPLGRHCHVSMESGPHRAPLCAGCSLARLGRAQLDADCVSHLVVFFLARTSHTASPGTSCSGGRSTHEGP